MTEEPMPCQLPPARCSRMLWMSLQQESDKTGKSLSLLVREAVELYLKDYDVEFQNMMTEEDA